MATRDIWAEDGEGEGFPGEEQPGLLLSEVAEAMAGDAASSLSFVLNLNTSSKSPISAKSAKRMMPRKAQG